MAVLVGAGCRSAELIEKGAATPADPPSATALALLCMTGGALVLTNVWLLLVVLSAIRRAASRREQAHRDQVESLRSDSRRAAGEPGPGPESSPPGPR